MMGKEEKTPWASTICCGIIIINFVVLRRRNTLYVKIAILLIIHCRAELAGKGEKRKILLQVGSGFTVGNSSYRPTRFENNKPDVALIQRGGRFFQNIRFLERLHEIVAVHQSQWEAKPLSINLSPKACWSRDRLVPNLWVFREFGLRT